MSALWSWPLPARDDMGLPVDHVDCWAIPLDSLPEEMEAAAFHLLSADERARAERFHFPHHRRLYACTHAALRLLLGRYLQVSPGSLAIVTDSYGRPLLAGEAGRVHFNLSHSGNAALVAVTCIAPLGVDLEEVRAVPDFLEIARRYFSRMETEHLSRLAPGEQLGGFYVTWTRKEAYVKALGLGLSYPLDAFSTGRPDCPPRLTQAEGFDSDWTLSDLATGGDFKAALAMRHPNVRIDCRQAAWPRLFGGSHPGAVNSATAASTAVGS